MNSKRNRKKEGFLQVKLSSRSALGKAWKRKWVVVQQNTSSTGKSLLVELYMEKGAYHKTVTSLLLEDVVSVRRTKSKTQEHAIEVSSSSKTLLGISADSETETQDWLSMFQINLLPSINELPCPPAIPQDFVRVSMIPNKDSERLKLAGDYFAHISLASINLYDTCTGVLALELDLRHLKKFMLISKCHPLDIEKIVHILPSKRSPKGEGEFIFFSAKGKQLVEGIYARLSNAMTVKSRRSRSTSMLFEITPQELEQMFKETDQPPEETLQEAEEEATEVNNEKKEPGEVNGETSEELPSGKELEANGVDGKEVVETGKTEPASDENKEDDKEAKSDGTGRAEPASDENKEDNTGSKTDRTGKAETISDENMEDDKEAKSDGTGKAEPPADENKEDGAKVKSDGTGKADPLSDENKEDDTEAKNYGTGKAEPASGENKEDGAKVKTDWTGKADPLSDENKDDNTEAKNDEATEMAYEEDKDDRPYDKSGQVEEAANNDRKQNVDAAPEVKETEPTAKLEDVAQQLGNICTTSGSQDKDTNLSDDKERDGNPEQRNWQDDDQDDDKANQTNPEEMDACIKVDASPSPDVTVEEYQTPNEDVVVSSQDKPQAKDVSTAKPVPSTEPVESDLNKESSLDVIMAVSSVNVESSADTQEGIAVSVDSDQGQDTLGGDATVTDIPIGGNEVQAEKNEASNLRLETQPIAHSCSHQESHEPAEDDRCANEELEPGLQDGTTPEEHPNKDIEETSVVEESTAETKPSSDINQEQSEQNTEPNDDPPLATAGECTPVEQIGTALLKQSPEQNETLGCLEIINEHSAAELNVETKLGTDATMISSETEPAAEISEQSLPDIDESMDNTPEVDTIKVYVGPAEPVTHGSELSENPNQNNSNSNMYVRSNSKTVPLPNALTSRMAEALVNVQKRRLSTDTSSPSQETQTEFPTDGHGTDQISEIIV